MRHFTLALLIFTLWGCEKKEEPRKEKPARVEATSTPIPNTLVAKFSGEKTLDHLKNLTAIGPRPADSPGYQKALAYVKKELHALGWKTTTQTFKATTPIGPLEFNNLLARYSPDDEPDWTRSTAYILGSHLDTKRYATYEFLGVNDSGSSSAALIELARVFSSDPGSAKNIELVFFDGEEALLKDIYYRHPKFPHKKDGLYGSQHYAKQLRQRRDQPQAAIVLDIIGDPKIPLQFCNESSPFLLKAAVQAGKDTNLTKRLRFANGIITDDHMPLIHSAALPSLLIIGDFMSTDYWHTINDTLENVTAPALEDAGKLTLQTLHHISQE